MILHIYHHAVAQYHIEKYGKHTADRAQKRICIAYSQFLRCPYDNTNPRHNAQDNRCNMFFQPFFLEKRYLFFQRKCTVIQCSHKITVGSFLEVLCGKPFSAYKFVDADTEFF